MICAFGWFVGGLAIGWLLGRTSLGGTHAHLKMGPIEYKRAGTLVLLDLWRWRFVKLGSIWHWKRIPEKDLI